MKIQTKICGITRAKDAQLAVKYGADAIGLVFFSGSKRCVTIHQAQNIVKILPPFVSVVALFVNETAERIHDILRQVPIDILQFHGDESSEFCQQFHRPYLKAIRVKNQTDIGHAMKHYTNARAVLFDAFVSGAYGGTGHTFDWRMLPQTLNGHWILSGGLNTENVAQAIRQTGAMAIDVSSGVEEDVGIKSAQKLMMFMQAIKDMDQNNNQ